MTVKLYVSLISCSQESRKNQQRAMMILESKNIVYTVIDITDPSNEDAKEYMVQNAEPSEGAKVPVTPQIFNEADYCGDFNSFDMANECDTLGDFLKLSEEEKASIKVGITGLTPANKDNISNNQNSELLEGVPITEKENLDEIVIESENIDGAMSKEIPVNGEIEVEPNEQLNNYNIEEPDIVLNKDEEEVEDKLETEQSAEILEETENSQIVDTTKRIEEAAEEIGESIDNENQEQSKEGVEA